jgi:intein/homing endonuclease
MTNERIARLVGHAFGDGYIHTTKFYLIYTNSSNSLHEYLTHLVSEEFGKFSVCERKSGKGVRQQQFSAKVGRTLHSYGAPKGSKIHQDLSIPTWIRTGPENVKASFLSAIFDDDGYFRDERNCMQIAQKHAKIKTLEDSLINYLQEISQLFDDLGIRTSEVKDDQEKTKQNKETVISKRIWITDKVNFQIFRKGIPIQHPEKQFKLTRMST